MPIPTEYTAETLQEFMHVELREVATILNWSVVEGSYAALVDNALELYGVTDISEATDIPRLRLLARVAVWRAVVTAVSLDYTFSDLGATYQRSQMVESARKILADLEVAAMPYLDEYVVTKGEISSPDDPYRVQPDTYDVL